MTIVVPRTASTPFPLEGANLYVVVTISISVLHLCNKEVLLIERRNHNTPGQCCPERKIMVYQHGPLCLNCVYLVSHNRQTWLNLFFLQS